jgi:hypothetical protein
MIMRKGIDYNSRREEQACDCDDCGDVREFNKVDVEMFVFGRGRVDCDCIV